MAKTLRSLVLLAVAVLCIVLMAGYSTGPKAEGQANQNNKAEAPQPDECILVEAFVVEVKLAALDELGVSPIGQKPNSVSVENILHCLGAKDMAQVSTGLKVSLKSEESGEAKTTETVYVEHLVNAPGGKRPDGRSPLVSKSFKSHNVGRQFNARAFIRPNGMILVGFAFDQNTYRQTADDDEAPENTVTRRWSGEAYLDPGQPAIVGATQDEETAVLLILCADVKGK
ncbi:MAG: hypothetical protein ABIF19_14855 [Planctomycetota bacterium]